MLIQHKTTGRIEVISDGSRVPGGWREVREAQRVETVKAVRCRHCNSFVAPGYMCRACKSTNP